MSDLNCFVLGLVELVKNTIANTISPDSILFSFFKSRFHKWKKWKNLISLSWQKTKKKTKKKNNTSSQVINTETKYLHRLLAGSNKNK